MTGRKKQVAVPGTTGTTGRGRAPHADDTPETGKATPSLLLDSTITCPECGSATRVRMPTDACQFFWDCPTCGALLRPKPGDCCVFCSWGDVACPPVQANRDCCR